MSRVEYSAAHTTKRRTVSLIMPARNEERSVAPTLDAVFTSTRLPDEIIIADGQSVDRTLERVQAYSERGVPIRVVSNPQIFAGAGRNRAAAVATGDVLLFLDFSILVHPRWIEEMTKPFEQDATVDAVDGVLEPYAESDFEHCVAGVQCQDLMLFSRLSRAEQLARVPAEIHLCGVMAITRACYLRMGGMPAWLRAAEDNLFGCKLLVARARIVRALDAVSYLPMRKDTTALFMQNLLYARGDGHIHRPLGYRERRNLLLYMAMLVAVGYGAVHPATLPVLLLLLLLLGAYLYRAGVRRVSKVSGGIVRLSHLLQIPRIIFAKDAGMYLGHLIGFFDWITKPHYRQLYQDYMSRIPRVDRLRKAEEQTAAGESVRPVTAVIVTYQSARTIGRTLAAARRCYDARLLDVVIVDNNSTDATRDVIGREAGWARLVLTGKNNGFGRGCNIGLAQVSSPYTIFINPDAVVEPEAIRTMLRFMEQNPKVGIVGPATVCGENGVEVLQHAGQRPTPWTILRDCAPFLRFQPKYWPVVPGSAPARTGWVCGAVFMTRTELMKELNGFDPRFFLYWEETDVCKRAEDAGFEIWAVGSALARHAAGASTSPDDVLTGHCIARHYFQSRYYYMVKHHGRLAATIAEVGECVLLVMRSLVDVARGRGLLNRLRPRLQARLLSQPERVKPIEDNTGGARAAT